ncbi:hypothetical protein AB3S75_045095 [Citrus x aurantiifolia]
MQRIPSELRSQACLGESSTKMGDLLGSPCVAPLLLSFQSVNPLFAADAFTFGAHQMVSMAGAGSVGHRGSAGGRGKGRGGTNFTAAEPRKDGEHGFSRFAVQLVIGATIPALMHRIPSELRCEACLGESSTKVDNLLGSPRVAPILLSFQPVNPHFAADAFSFCARRMVSIAGAGSPGHLGAAGGWGKGRGGANCAAAEPGQDGEHGFSRFAVHMMMGATIPALMHRIPSKLRS